MSEIVTAKCNINYLYKVYGLNVKSDIMISELMTSEKSIQEDFEVSVCLESVPDDISSPKVKYENYQISDNELLFYIKGVAKYYISNGNKIVVQPDENATLNDIKTFLLGSSFGAILTQRDSIAVHGGAMMICGKSYIFTGDMGSGKSTLTSAFRVRGYSFLSDDVSVTGMTKDGLTVLYPGYPQQKLCGDTMLKLGYNLDDFKMINSDRNKFAIPVHNDFINEPIPLGGIIELTVGEVDEVKIIEIKGIDKIKAVYENIYRVEFIRDVGLRPSFYKNYINMVKNTPLYRIIRPRDIFSVEEQIDIICKTLNVAI